MPKKTIVTFKDPQSKQPYSFDWATEWLEPGDIIVSSSWSVPSGLSQPYSSGFTDTTTYVWLAGGTLGETYVVTNHIITAQHFEEDAVWIFTMSDEF